MSSPVVARNVEYLVPLEEILSSAMIERSCHFGWERITTCFIWLHHRRRTDASSGGAETESAAVADSELAFLRRSVAWEISIVVTGRLV